MWFTFSLFTMLAWGSGNLFQKLGTNNSDKTSHWKIVIWVGLIMGIHAIGFMIYNSYAFDFRNIIYYFPVSFLYIASMTFSYVGLRYMELSILSPVCNTSGAVTALLCFFILKQEISPIQIFAIVLVVIGVYMLSYFEKKESQKEMALKKIKVEKKYMYGAMALIFPLLYCALDGIGSFADAFYLEYYLSEEDALLAYEFTFLIAAILAFLYIKLYKKTTFVKKDEGYKMIAGICEMLGQFFYIYAMADNAIVAAPMIASYCVISVILSRIVLKEKLSKGQYLSIIIVMIAVAILGIE